MNRRLNRRIILGIIFLFCFSIADSQTPFFNWAKTAGGTDSDRGGAVIYTHDGNILVTGFFSGDAQFDTATLHASVYGMFIAKYDTAGNLIWVKKTAESDEALEPRKIYEDPAGNIFVFGYFGTIGTGGNLNFISGNSYTSLGGRDVFAAKFDSQANPTWQRRIGSEDEEIAQSTFDGKNFLIQCTQNATLFAQNSLLQDSIVFDGSFHIDLIRYDSSGAINRFKKFIKSIAQITPADLTIDTSGRVYMTGMNYSLLTVGIAPDLATLPAAAGGTDIYIVKMDPDSMKRKWQQKISGTGNETAHVLEINSNNAAVLTGNFSNHALFGAIPDTATLHSENAGTGNFLVCYDTSGSIAFLKNSGYSAGGIITVTDMAHNDSLLYVTGQYTGTPVFGEGTDTVHIPYIKNFFIASFNDTGSLHWARTSAGTFLDGLSGITLDKSGGAYVCGFFTFYCILDTSASDTIYLTTAGVDDAVLARIGYIIQAEDTTVIDTTGENHYSDSTATDDSETAFDTLSTNYNSVSKECLNIYPNPSSELITVDREQTNSEVLLELFDSRGRKVFVRQIPPDTKKLLLDTHSLAAGTYLITIKSGEKIFYGKIVVQK